ncbi:hypothetical protein CTEN210_00837 [Chaetoceros tenuissimus]|uniref:Leucine-rich repeat domain-containing protein n=1 Tax=Chaetoceros tenuissimus TaxID=426638 RepID=A0AAD3CEH2_9STRA|nr:hypothetical protein CTEN210_00837 [Chaetoceros tenuissimus]
MADTFRRIEDYAFECCHSLEFVRLSTDLEYIGYMAFRLCKSLTSIYIPPSCREIDEEAFHSCEKLIIFNVPQHTELGNNVIARTALKKVNIHFNNEVNNDEWIKDINEAEEFALHRACSSFNPLEEIIHAIVKRQGRRSLKKKNHIGVTPLQYIDTNPYTDIEEKKIMKQYILDMMGVLH